MRAGAVTAGLRNALTACFGLHPTGFRVVQERPSHDAALRELRIAFDDGQTTRAFLALPATPPPWPMVLVLHAHGARYDIGAQELIDGRPALAGPLAPDLTERGIAALCCDMPCFGSRQAQSESALSKALLWEGRTLAGRMLSESIAALDWIAADARFIPGRIGVYGLSMGATLGYWLAALDQRVRALAHLCCLADFRALIAAGAHDLHGAYLTVPGLLPLASNGRIAGMVAPRAQFVGLGDLDPLTPPAAADAALTELRAAYARDRGRLVLHREPDSGHVETAAMRAAVLIFLQAELSGAQGQGA